MLYNTYKKDIDYKEVESPSQVLKGRPPKAFAVTKQTFVAILCRTKNPISLRVLEYFYTLQELVVRYYKSQVDDHEKSVAVLLALPVIVEHTAKQSDKYAVAAAETRAGFVYALHEAGDTTHFKIGFAHDVAHRIAQLQIGNRRELVCYRAVATKDMAGDEAYLHRRHKAARRQGEWFELSAAEVDEACAHLAAKNESTTAVELDELDALLAELGFADEPQLQSA
jgi:hypothetical protein